MSHIPPVPPSTPVFSPEDSKSKELAKSTKFPCGYEGFIEQVLEGLRQESTSSSEEYCAARFKQCYKGKGLSTSEQESFMEKCIADTNFTKSYTRFSRTN